MKPCMRCKHATAWGCHIGDENCDQPDLPDHPLTPLKGREQIRVESASAASGTNRIVSRPSWCDDDAPTGSKAWEEWS